MNLPKLTHICLLVMAAGVMAFPQIAWAQTIKNDGNSLYVNPDYRVLPGERAYHTPDEMVPNDWSVALNFGVAPVFFSSNMKDHFKNAIGFHIGLAGGYKSVRLAFDATYAQPGYRSETFFKRDEKNRPVHGNSATSSSMPHLALMLGYNIYNGSRLAITPYAGVAFNSIRWNIDNYSYTVDPEDPEKYIQHIDSTDRHKLSSVNWKVAVDFDIRLSRSVSKKRTVFNSEYEQLNVGLKISPFISQVGFNQTIYDEPFNSKGLMFGVSINLLLEAYGLRF